jgi:hypothetical protein
MIDACLTCFRSPCEQVLEFGIVAHSVIIGISMGTSESPCKLTPLLVAIAFHQFFEGVGLGGCIAQVRKSVCLCENSSGQLHY